MRYLSLIFLNLILFASFGAFATGGADIGGGLGLACFNAQRIADHVFHQNGKIADEYIPSIVNVTPIDLAEASMAAPANSQLISADQSEDQKDYTDRLLNIVGRDFPSLAANIRQVKQRLKTEFVMESLPLMSDAELPDDWNNNNHCTVVTLAVQNRQQITIDQRLFSKMDATAQGVLMLHEYLYYYGRQTHGHRSSRGTREVIKHFVYDNLHTRRELAAQQLIEFGFITGE